MSVSVCLSACVCVFVCPRAHLRIHTSDLYQIFPPVTYGRGLVLFWRRCDMLCTSGFMDDVILAHKPRQLNVAAKLIKVQPTCSLGLSYKWHVGIPVSGLLFGLRGLGLLNRSGFVEYS